MTNFNENKIMIVEKEEMEYFYTPNYNKDDMIKFIDKIKEHVDKPDIKEVRFCYEDSDGYDSEIYTLIVKTKKERLETDKEYEARHKKYTLDIEDAKKKKVKQEEDDYKQYLKLKKKFEKKGEES